MTEPNETAALLDRHAARRADGVPTVSVLVGPVGACGATWRRWATGSGRVVVAVHRPADAPAAWVDALARGNDLPALAIGAVADRLGRDRAEFAVAWRGKTAADRTRFWDAVFPDRVGPATRTLADFATGDSPMSHGTVSSALFEGSISETADRVVRELVALAPTAVPAVLFAPVPASDVAAWLAKVATGAADWAVRHPTVPAAVAVTTSAWKGYRATAPESRAKAVLREGVIEVPVREPDAVTRALADAGLGADAGPVTAALVAGGVTDDLVRSAADAVRANVPPPATPEADDRARSAAERFLFDLLESVPETAGRFSLNGTLDFRFGPRPAEVDLLARAEKLAVEVDGYHHFRGPDGYRRDRAKDYQLQRRGFFVLRFLADDVVHRIEDVRDRILEALSRSPPEGCS